MCNFGEIPNVDTLLGATIIIASTLYIVHRKNSSKKKLPKLGN